MSLIGPDGRNLAVVKERNKTTAVSPLNKKELKLAEEVGLPHVNMRGKKVLYHGRKLTWGEKFALFIQQKFGQRKASQV